MTEEDIKKREVKRLEEAKKQAEKKLKDEQKKMNKQKVQTVDEEVFEVDETRQPASMVLIGHVDSGKSTISGQIMYMMGVVDQRTI